MNEQHDSHVLAKFAHENIQRFGQDPLTIMRTSLRRIAECTKDSDIIAAIPTGGRGWNTLAAILCDWVETHRQDFSVDTTATQRRTERTP
jgi:hypothetical protein